MDQELTGRLRKIGDPLMNQAAAAIQELTEKLRKCEAELNNCRDELCLKCGEYRNRHLGACNGCRYKEIG